MKLAFFLETRGRNLPNKAEKSANAAYLFSYENDPKGERYFFFAVSKFV